MFASRTCGGKVKIKNKQTNKQTSKWNISESLQNFLFHIFVHGGANMIECLAGHPCVHAKGYT